MAGELSFIELGTGDLERARSFYGELLGWTFEDHGQGAVIEGAGVPGGIHGGDQGASPYAFFAVDDLDAAVARLRALGGEVQSDLSGDEAESAARFGRFALCTDDQGSAFGLHEPPAHG